MKTISRYEYQRRFVEAEAMILEIKWLISTIEDHTFELSNLPLSSDMKLVLHFFDGDMKDSAAVINYLCSVCDDVAEKKLKPLTQYSIITPTSERLQPVDDLLEKLRII